MRPLLQEHILFATYRWCAWVLAVLVLFLDMPLASNHIALLLLSGILTLVATALAQPMVRVARVRPILLALDILVGLALVALSGGDFLPFFPYALGTLILPAVLFGWRGALMAGVSFALADRFGLLLAESNLPGGALTETSAAAIAGRMLIPAGVALLWVAIWQTLQQVVARAVSPLASRFQSVQPPARPFHDANDMLPLSNRTSRTVTTRQATTRTAQSPTTMVPFKMPSRMGLSSSSSAENFTVQELRRVIHENVTTSPNMQLDEALSQLVATCDRWSSVAMHVHVTGTISPLSYAKSLTLVRLAEAALLNVEQHARAHSAAVTLSYEPLLVTLTIQDDGVGLLDGTYVRPGLHTLRAIAYCLAEQDGYLEVNEGVRGGVVVRAVLPLHNS
ncbi:MAG: hypothetical protein HC893_01305 [Chloroflexaceae bacterium]|nr:hypothetical protein [Chloroflexaceae bacterium]NJL32727.1 hypothetical protein [Chloroflexaceae bacterium]NJO05888.1 hypothetical protein [Chloroflexaceae bacterium]